MLFITVGGWLLNLWTYKGVLFGLGKGLNVSFSRSKKTSKNSSFLVFAVDVVPRPCCVNIAATKKLSPFLAQGVPSLKSKEFFACMIIFSSSGVIFTNFLLID